MVSMYVRTKTRDDGEIMERTCERASERARFGRGERRQRPGSERRRSKWGKNKVLNKVSPRREGGRREGRIISPLKGPLRLTEPASSILNSRSLLTNGTLKNIF